MKVYILKYDWYDTFQNGSGVVKGVYLHKLKAEQEREKMGEHWGLANIYVDELEIDETRPEGKKAHERRVRRG